MSEKDGGPAFPSLEEFDRFDDDRGKYVTTVQQAGGMTLRDYFAAQALVRVCVTVPCGMPENAVELIAQTAYAIADAMLKERAK